MEHLLKSRNYLKSDWNLHLSRARFLECIRTRRCVNVCFEKLFKKTIVFVYISKEHLICNIFSMLSPIIF